MTTDTMTRETEGPTVLTTEGRLQGVSRNGVDIFRGIPYAAPPVGALRFQPPIKPQPWTDVREAKQWPNSAVQEKWMDFAPLRWYRSSMATSEDCLYLNVFTPGTDDAKRPVMVWFHGGAFSTGAGTAAGFEGSTLARRGDVVVVTVNHRLNVFGYFCPGPEAGESFADSANAGMLDLVAALEWVRDNIASFGGDPECVTIFGESGGGGKVGRLMAMPSAAGLFHRAILQSSGMRSGTTEMGQEAAAHLLNQFGLTAKDADKLRDVPAEDLLAARLNTVEALGYEPFEPLPDGRSLPERPFGGTAPAISAQVPLMIGTCHNEALYRLVTQPDLFDQPREQFVARLADVGNMPHDAAEKIFALYELKDPQATPFDIYADVMTDQRFRMSTIETAEQKAVQEGADCWLYRFTWKSPVMEGRLKAVHTIEVPFVFGTMEAARDLVGTGPELEPLCDIVMGAWVAFARNGRPDHPGLPAWKPYSTSGRETMLLNSAPRLVSDEPGPELVALKQHRLTGGFKAAM